MSRSPQDSQIYRIETYQLTEGDVLPMLTFRLFEGQTFFRHGFTMRDGGVSSGIYSSLNLSYTRGDDPECVTENFRRVAHVFDTDLSKIVTSDQTHTTNIRRVTFEDAGAGILKKRGFSDIDGMICNEPGLLLGCFFADCVPLFFADPVHHAIGLSHSGWRGTVGRMGEKTLLAMNDAFGTDPADVLCGIGPSICMDCYEVSEDVIEQAAACFCGPTRRPEVSERIPESMIFQKTSPEKYHLNLWKANERILLESGVLPEHLAVGDVCTCCHPQLFFSHRASHGKRGNLGAFMILQDSADRV